MLDSLSVVQLIIAAGAVFLAFLVRGALGFGSGLVAVPLLVLMFPLTLVVPVVSVLEYLASATHGVVHRSAIVRGDLLALLPFSVAGLLAALYLFETVEPGNLTKALGVFILLYAAWSFLAVQPRKRHSRLWGIPLGLLAGLVGTLFGTGGPFYVIYFKLRHLDKTQFRATFATVFLIEGLARLVGYALAGLLDRDSLILAVVGVPMLALGLYVGGHIHHRLSQTAFQRGVSVLLVVAGGSLLFK